MDQNCTFCKIINGHIPGTIVYQDENVVAFQDAPPLQPCSHPVPNAMEVRHQTPHNDVIRTKDRDPRGEKDEPRHHREQASDYAENQQAYAQDGAEDVAHTIHYASADGSVSWQA